MENIADIIIGIMGSSPSEKPTDLKSIFGNTVTSNDMIYEYHKWDILTMLCNVTNNGMEIPSHIKGITKTALRFMMNMTREQLLVTVAKMKTSKITRSIVCMADIALYMNITFDDIDYLYDSYGDDIIHGLDGYEWLSGIETTVYLHDGRTVTVPDCDIYFYISMACMYDINKNDQIDNILSDLWSEIRSMESI